MRDPSAWSVIGGWLLALALILVIYGGWALVVRAFKTPTPTRPAAQMSRVGVGPKCVACGKPAVKAVRAGLTSWLLCGECRRGDDALTGRAS